MNTFTARRRAAAGALFLSVLFMVGAGLSSAQSSGRTAITVATSAPADTLPFYYAIQKGMFEKVGLDVTVLSTTSGSAGLLAVIGGAAQFALSNTLTLSMAHAKGVPIQIIAPGAEYDSTSPNVKIITGSDSAVQTPKDLEGKVVAVPGLHDLIALSTYAWLEKNGVDSSKVKFTELSFITMVAALQQKRVDAVVVPEPYLNAAETAGARVIGNPYDAVATKFMAGAWFGNRDWMKDHRDVALRFADVMNQSQKYTNAHYSELIPMIAGFSKVPLEMVKKMTVTRVSPTLQPTLVQPVIDLAAKYKEFSASFRAQELFFPGAP